MVSTIVHVIIVLQLVIVVIYSSAEEWLSGSSLFLSLRLLAHSEDPDIDEPFQAPKGHTLTDTDDTAIGNNGGKKDLIPGIISPSGLFLWRLQIWFNSIYN